MQTYTVAFVLRNQNCEMDFRCMETPDAGGFSEDVVNEIAADIVSSIKGASYLYSCPKENT